MLKNRLRNEEPLPEDLSWENMKGDIYDRMDKIENVKANKKKRFAFFFLFGLLILGFGWSMLNYFGSENPDITEVVHQTDQNTTRDISVSNQSESSNSKTINSISEKSVYPVNKSNDTVNSPSYDEKSYAINTPAADRPAVDKFVTNQGSYDDKHNELSTSYLSMTAPSTKAPRNLNNSREVADFGEVEPSNSMIDLSTDPQKTAMGILDKEEGIDSNTTTLLPNLAIQLLNYSLEEVSAQSLSFSSKNSVKKPKNKGWLLDLGGGVNFGISDMGVLDEQNLVQSNESLVLGHAASLRISNTYGKLYVSTGFEWKDVYRQNKGKLEFVQEIDTLALVGVTINQLIATNMYTDTTLLSTDNVDFTLQNNLNFVSVPLVVGFQDKRAGFYYNAGAGVNLSFNNQFTSKNINYSGSGSDYDVTEFTSPKKFAVDIFGELGFGYEFKNNIRIGTRFTYLVKPGKYVGKFQNINSPSLVNGELTIGYKL